MAIPLALGVAIATSFFRLLLWRARSICQALDDDDDDDDDADNDALHVWKDGSMMVSRRANMSSFLLGKQDARFFSDVVVIYFFYSQQTCVMCPILYSISP